MSKVLKALQTEANDAIQSTFISLTKRLNYTSSPLLDAVEYALLSGGKRMRPLLLSITGTMLSANKQDINVASLAIECIHSYSLVHDDLPAMDNDDLRRGKPTCHIKYDEATAILAGDALQSSAFECLSSMPLSEYAQTKRHELIAILAKASGMRGMCQGQSLDLLATGETISLDDLIKLHQLKTGALIESAVSMATCLSPTANEDTRKLLSVYSKAIGLAFQIQDDILDLTSDTATLGKPQGSDLINGKSTFVTHLGLQGAKDALTVQYEEALHALEQLPYNTEQLKLFTQYMVARTH
ncbi:polyprenyl synthetase family protein [Agaribacter marinus]|uniref:Geranyltranstransferase n=1 Tax=Agaribacter marinus TaxID=1431249 RepID=A0AA37WLW8_9ALTE|nr:farnesyl diphosphate synthase [Agaribacter marinus]GLR73069.1 geranyltranstransferase [Agaribacter marinus]